MVEGYKITLSDKIFFWSLAIIIAIPLAITGIGMYVLLYYERLRGRDVMIGMRGTLGKGNKFQ